MSNNATYRSAWSRWEDTVLRGMFRESRPEVIASVIGRTPAAVKSRAKVLGVHSSERRYWTLAEDKLLRKLYPDNPSAELARRFNCSISSVYKRANRLGIYKSAEYMERCGAECGAQVQQFGASHRYPKGHVPANKGMKRPGWAPGRMAETQFKKGQLNGRAKQLFHPVGTVKPNGNGYLVRKIDAKINNGVGAQNRNWEFVHKRVWEDAKGPIPPGHRIWWKDGNHANCALDNLEPLSDAEHMARTTIHNLPPELKQVIQLTGALKRKIRNQERKLYGKEQDRRPAQPSVRDAGELEGLRA